MAQCLGEKFNSIVNYFDIMRRKRNDFTYEVDKSISETEARNACETAEKFVDLICKLIQDENPQHKLVT